MSSPNPPFKDVAPGAAPQPAREPSRALAAELAHSEASPAIGILRSRPPEEVLAQMARADAINERLRERGYRVGFRLEPGAVKLLIELRDSAGTPVRILSAAEAVELAAGRLAV